MVRHSGEIVKAAMKKKDTTQVELARKIGKDQTLISKYLAGRTEISVEVARSMAEVLEIDFEELRRQLKRDKLERRRALLRAEFKEIFDEEESELATVAGATIIEATDIVTVPLLDSIPSDVDDQRRETAEKYPLPPNVQVDAESAFALKVSGADMTDDVVDEGDIIVVDPNAETQDDDRVLMILNGKPVLGKIYRKGKTVALQLPRELIFLSKEDDFKIVGRMVSCNKIFTPS